MSYDFKDAIDDCSKQVNKLYGIASVLYPEYVKNKDIQMAAVPMHLVDSSSCGNEKCSAIQLTGWARNDTTVRDKIKSEYVRRYGAANPDPMVCEINGIMHLVEPLSES